MFAERLLRPALGLDAIDRRRLCHDAVVVVIAARRRRRRPQRLRRGAALNRCGQNRLVRDNELNFFYKT